MDFKAVSLLTIVMSILATIVSPRPRALTTKVEEKNDDAIDWLLKPSMNSTNNSVEKTENHKDKLTSRTRRNAMNPCRVSGSSKVVDGIMVFECHPYTTMGCNLQNNINGACRPVQCSHNSTLLTIDCECDNASTRPVKKCST